MKVEHTYHFQKCADAAYQKLSKLVDACGKYSLPKLAHYYYAMLCIAQTMPSQDVCLSVRHMLVFCQKWLDISSNFLHRWLAKQVGNIPTETHPNGHFECKGSVITRSSAVAKRPRDASCLYSFKTKRRAQSFIISCFGFRYTTACN